MRRSETLVQWSLALVALFAIAALALIIIFIFKEGSPIIARLGIVEFIMGTKWSPSRGTFGILPMILGSFWVTLSALVIGVPIGLASAIFLAEMAPSGTSRILKFAIQLLAGIPSVVFGFIGLVILVPLIRQWLGGPGFSVLAAGIVLGIMILPTIVSVCYDVFKAVPQAYREGMIALGATRWQTIRMVVLPAARPGIIAAIILGMGRAVGETMAVIMVAGNATKIPVSLLEPVRTLTSNIALEMGYAVGEHREALFATGIVLFIIIAILNTLARVVARVEKV
ncbi:MAG: phosphate ABC transporter permease subunit PstC [Bacillota bacterium]|jgi:phosphate transport system permease protein|nr:phosphate ABC transporter permease subunit PstC [Bacillota bacterium]MDI9415887.1 phosphate ABC transporter permease subunit PstC [Bacillota bacterium]NLD12046.1 phosphate ABC transporter permease subunit PstC [Bacillota bacterium]HAV21485.1 phosphate ABC transporter permease subunit PstC [Bacillota bacterium]HCD41857.1 phosphate ABC transporter permease subunit PstC [Bacillota bacterium]